MSIWVSHDDIGFDSWRDYKGKPKGGQVRSYATGWSNHYPTTSGHVERRAAIDLAHIPAWCAGGDDDDFTSVGRWLRLSVDSWQHNYHKPTEVIGKETATVVMDEDAVRALVAQLTEWLDTPKVSPSRNN